MSDELFDLARKILPMVMEASGNSMGRALAASLILASYLSMYLKVTPDEMCDILRAQIQQAYLVRDRIEQAGMEASRAPEFRVSCGHCGHESPSMTAAEEHLQTHPAMPASVGVVN